MSDGEGNKKDVFLSTDEKACAHTIVEVSKFPAILRIEWFDPNNTSYKVSWNAPLPAPIVDVVTCMKIAGDPPATFPGKWSTKFFIDGTTHTELSFLIEQP